MNINLEWYRIFLYTAKSGNLTLAAKELHITQPSVSYALKQLEAMLEVKLFQRMSKGVRLTSEGAALLSYVEKSFSMLDAGESQLQSLKDLTAGELRIGASGPIIKHVLLPQLDSFHAEHPDVRIRLAQGKSSDLRTRLKEGQIDLGLVHLPLHDESLDVTPLIEIQDCFVVGPAYEKWSKDVLNAEELAKIPLLLLTPGSSTRVFSDQWFASQGLEVEADIELSSMEMLIELSERGYGAAFVTQSFVKQELESGKLFQIRTEKMIPSRSIGIATRRDSSMSLIATHFIELLTNKISF